MSAPARINNLYLTGDQVRSCKYVSPMIFFGPVLILCVRRSVAGELCLRLTYELMNKCNKRVPSIEQCGDRFHYANHLSNASLI